MLLVVTEKKLKAILESNGLEADVSARLANLIAASLDDLTTVLTNMEDRILAGTTEAVASAILEVHEEAKATNSEMKRGGAVFLPVLTELKRLDAVAKSKLTDLASDASHIQESSLRPLLSGEFAKHRAKNRPYVLSPSMRRSSCN